MVPYFALIERTRFRFSLHCFVQLTQNKEGNGKGTNMNIALRIESLKEAYAVS